jgi:SAM-dependent methyltransferase
MADVPYGAWFDFALDADHFTTKQRILELFSGHAPFLKIASQRGIAVIALDVERAMLSHTVGDRVCATALALPVVNATITLAAATNASINYLQDVPELVQHFAEVKRVLVPGGAYVFDCCTPGRAETLHLQTMQSASGEIFFSHIYNRVENILETTVKIKERGTEHHRQRIFTMAELNHCATTAGFVIEQVVPNYGLPVAAINEPIVTLVLRPS